MHGPPSDLPSPSLVPNPYLVPSPSCTQLLSVRRWALPHLVAGVLVLLATRLPLDPDRPRTAHAAGPPLCLSCFKFQGLGMADVASSSGSGCPAWSFLVANTGSWAQLAWPGPACLGFLGWAWPFGVCMYLDLAIDGARVQTGPGMSPTFVGALTDWSCGGSSASLLPKP
ncbi:unnamed protein product [Calypogeia fissa]